MSLEKTADMVLHTMYYSPGIIKKKTKWKMTGTFITYGIEQQVIEEFGWET
jgi:hypothetical protein